MRALLTPLEELAEYNSIKESLRGTATKKPGCVTLTGCVDSQKLQMIWGISLLRFKSNV